MILPAESHKCVTWGARSGAGTPAQSEGEVAQEVGEVFYSQLNERRRSTGRVKLFPKRRRTVLLQSAGPVRPAGWRGASDPGC